MRKIMICVIILIIILLIFIFSINFHIKNNTKNQIKTEQEAQKIENIDCILVLGAGIWNNEPSPMLEDRLLQAISLYDEKVAPKILMSGDHSKKDYDEVNIMKQFAIDRGVPSEDIFMDHAGFSSYESVYRAKEIFDVKKMIIVTQKYHLYRALYIANQLGVEAYGVASDPRQYIGQTYREAREILARNKDFLQCIFKPTPTFLGDKISITGSGDATNDKEFFPATTTQASSSDVIYAEIDSPEKQIKSKITDWNLILVNKDNKIPDDYKFELQTIENKNQVDSRIVDALSQMLADARNEGLDPFICSSYRTRQTQTTLYNQKVKQYKRQGLSQANAEIEASYWVTYPGTSEHEVGLALDIVSNGFKTLNEQQENTAVQKWLMENCNKYGFVLRYPTDKKDITKINYEPWHYRYVGIENATFMKDKGLCLEEFIDYLKSQV